VLKTKIEWCDHTWNPVWGCKNSCPYCYARRLAKRFNKDFKPHFVEKNFNMQFSAMDRIGRVFVNSMSDIAYWKEEWMEKVLAKIRENLGYNFLFLTKHPEIYYDYFWPENTWLGVTATTNDELRLAYLVLLNTSLEENLVFVSIEPILEPIEAHDWIGGWDWLIVGAETGNRKGKVIPEKEWIDPLLSFKIPIFMKDSLIPIWGENMRREWPNADN